MTEIWLCFHATQAKEQHTGQIIDTLNRCVGLLPRDKLQHVSSIGLSGQMHGILLWKAKSGKNTVTSDSICGHLRNNGCGLLMYCC